MSVSLRQLGSAAADQMTLRRFNLATLLGSLRDNGPRSRARLASDLGLNKATVSSLVSELMERGLVREAGEERGNVGRPGVTVELDGHRVCGVGIEINVHYVGSIAIDLGGDVVFERRTRLNRLDTSYERVVDQLVELLVETLDELDSCGVRPVSVVIGAAGLVDQTLEMVMHAPNLGWHRVELGAIVRQRLAARLGHDLDFSIEIDNEANLAAVAEATPGVEERRNMLVIFGEIGVGGGIVADGNLLRGNHGYAGEFGHMTVDHAGRRCGCGRIGCWETVVGLSRLLELSADPDDSIRNPELALSERLAEISRRAELGDQRVLGALREVGYWLGVGAAMLCNTLNPGLIVLSGYFSQVGPWMTSVIEDQLAAGVLAPEAGGTKVELSTLGFTASMRGGAAVALDHIFSDPTEVARTPDRPAVPGGSSDLPADTSTVAAEAL